MTMDIDRQGLALERWTTRELRQRYLDIFGEAARSHNKTWLRKRIIWRLQALAEGDLSERARQRAAELARDADLRLSSPRRQAVPMATPLPKEQAKASFPSPYLEGSTAASAWFLAHPLLQGTHHPGEGAVARVPVPGQGLLLVECPGQGNHR